jgi:hypothetical protein
MTDVRASIPTPWKCVGDSEPFSPDQRKEHCMKRVKGSRGWIAAAFTILFTIGLIAVRTEAAIQPSGEAPTTLTTPMLSDSNGHVACPTDVLFWTSVTGATSYQIWSGALPEPTFVEIYSGTALGLEITVPRGRTYVYEAAACDAQGCSGFSHEFPVTGGSCD